MKRILVPTNCNEASENAFRLATQFSQKSNARVYLLRVVKTHGGAYFDKTGEIVEDHAHDVQQYRFEKENAVKKLDEWVRSINPKAHKVVKYGGIADVILETIKKYKISLVIIGNKFTDTKDNRFFGDLTAYLIRKSKAPILSLKSGLTTDSLKKIVFANEFNHTINYFDALQDISNYCTAPIDFLKVKTDLSESEEEIGSNMDYFARMNMIFDYNKCIHDSPNPEQGILEWISSHDCDLLAVKNVTQWRSSPLFSVKLSQKFLSNSSISTLVYND